MTPRRIVPTIIAALLALRGVSAAGGLFYTQQANVSTPIPGWYDIAAKNDVRAGGKFNGRLFADFPTSARAAIAADTAGSGDFVAVFAAKFQGLAPNTGIFLYDYATGHIIDIANEGDPFDVAGDGFYGPFAGQNPSVAIEGLYAAVSYRSKAVGAGAPPLNQDTKVEMAYYLLGSDLPPIGKQWRAGEGDPSPIAGTVYGDFPSSLETSSAPAFISAQNCAGVAFVTKLVNPPTGGTVFGDGSNDTALVIGADCLGYPKLAVQAGEAGCASHFGGADYAKFTSKQHLALATDDHHGSGFALGFRAKAAFGASSTADTGIEIAYPGVSYCHTEAVIQEGQPTSGIAGGTFGDFPEDVSLALSNPSDYLYFSSKVTGVLDTPSGIFAGDGYSGGGNNAFVLVRSGQPDTSAGLGLLSLPTNPQLTVSGGSIGWLFVGKVKNLASGVFGEDQNGSFASVPIMWSAENPRVDGRGNITARMP
ncbi:MAG: hypothetical protein HYR72_13065 [Deltaproteobacteria bacterium]|nr:hypothetical protein [Deltaproteobacteria bacterium]MBI3390488.1 hypothetical protein [Deltaproteobacteria bacterium]